MDLRHPWCLDGRSLERRHHRAEHSVEGSQSWHWALAAALGITAGFVTLIANAAGPLMALYLVAMRLPKMQFVGINQRLFDDLVLALSAIAGILLIRFSKSLCSSSFAVPIA